MSEFLAGPVGAKLAYELRGNTGPFIVFVHGLSANRKCFQFLENALHAQMDCTTLTYDLRGRGHSDKPQGPYGPRVHAADLGVLLGTSRLRKLKTRPVIIAHSLGAYAALEYASRTALRALVLLDGGGSLNRLEAVCIYTLLRLSFIRLGKRFPSESEYLDLVRKSPLVREWNPQMEALLRYDEAKQSGLFHAFFVVEPVLRQYIHKDPWLVGSLIERSGNQNELSTDNRRAYIVLAYWA